MRYLFYMILIMSLTELCQAQATTTEPGFLLKIIDADTCTSSRFVPFEEISSFPVHTIQLQDQKSKKYITWEGVYLQEFLSRQLKIDWQDIYRLIIKAPDGYSSVISGSRMSEAQNALCAFRIQSGGEWKSKFGYMRLIFPDMHEMHWMNNPSEVTLIIKNKNAEKPLWKFLFFDSPVFQHLQTKTDEEMAEWSVDSILATMGSANREFTIFTGDGQLREYLLDEVGQRMKLAADSTGLWKIRGGQIPIGFRLRKIFFLCSENVGLFTKSLGAEERKLWQHLFSTINPFMSQNKPAAEITLILASGETIPAINFEAYQAGNISLVQLMQMEKDARTDLQRIDVRW